MNEEHKKRGLAHGKLLTAVVIASLFIGSGAAMANEPASIGYEVTEQMQNIVVSGSVTDAKGEAIIGASVLEKGTTNGIITDMDGKFTLTVKPGATLIVSYVGFKQQEVKAARNLQVVLQEDSELLDEVIVVGYGSQKKVNLTGAVANVDVEKAIASRPVTDVAKALQGISPGLSITTNTGGIGVDSKIRLRGATGSLSATEGTSPLILVDNVEVPSLNLINPDDIQSISVLKDAASASIYGTRAAWGVILITTKSGKKNDKVKITYSNNFAWNTPTTMPKVAKTYESAQAMLLAAQRQGKDNISSIGYNVDAEAIQKMKDWEQQYGGMSQSQLGEMQLGRDFENRGGKYYFYRSFDPVDMFLKDWTPQQKHNLSITGGSDKTTFNISLGYLQQEGVLKANTDKYDRYNFNVNITTQVREWWKIRTNVMFSRSTKTEPYKYTSGYTDVWYYLLRWPAFYPYADYEGLPFRSAITEIAQAKQEKLTNNFTRVNIGTELNPIKDLSINFDYTFALLNDYQKREGGEVWGYDIFNTANPLTYSSLYSSSHNRVLERSRYTMSNTFKAYATYEKSFVEKHNLKVMVGMDAEKREKLGHSSDRKTLVNFDQPEIALAVGDQFVDGTAYHNDFAAAGFFGRINYNYMQKYLLEVNARYDGSSKFPSGKKWALFPSVSAGWRVSEEAFMQWAKPVLSNFKIRGSWGTIGNQDVAANSFLSVMSVGAASGWVIDGKEVPYIGAPSVISPSLTWERVTTIDVGFDARFFNDDLGLSFDWYQRTTTDMHSPGETLPSTFGNKTMPKVNSGELRGRGFEFALDYNHRFANGLEVNARATLSKIREKLTKYNNPNKNIYGNYEGKIIGEIWGYETDRLFQYEDCKKVVDGGKEIWVIDTDKVPTQELFESGSFRYGPGDVKYKDRDGDGEITYGDNTLENHGDLKRIGNTLPNFEYGFSLGIIYKGFDFSTFFQGIGSRDCWVVGQTGIPGFMPTEGWLAHQMDYWTEENTEAFYPRPTSHSWVNNGQNFLRQTRYLQDLSYLRCKNITLGYTVPERWMKKIAFTNGRIYVSAENVFEFDNVNIPVDPETTEAKSATNGEYSFGKSYPFTRTISFGVQLTF